MRSAKVAPSGMAMDIVTCFKYRWKLDQATETALRALNYGNLRYVLDTSDGERPLKEVIEEAKAREPATEVTQIDDLPDQPGVLTMGRFSRLELIDPLANCAVFGDANLTFSLRLARHRHEMGHAGRVLATTFEDLPTLQERYKEINESIQELEDEYYAEVYHSVDCTRIAIDPQFKGMEGSLGAVYYNFPHSGGIQKFFDAHPCVNWRHENLMRLFFRALRTYVKPGGIVKVASNAKATGVRFTFIILGAKENEFVHEETVKFTDWHLHRYGRSYGDKRDLQRRPDAKNNESYNAQTSGTDMLYCFRYRPSGNELGPQFVRLPPTLSTLAKCNDGPFKLLPAGEPRMKLAKELHQRFVSECSGIHVG
eukprot:gnl/TRDRNA2_/TRDRNA2_41251_c0_seq1.p1 gnl/TRDRNA2_/TRDRNA2_41251_c0~~gnl/TRDRNA2_/TRDRNA2_41251_c0_seq1.p1  ORF type:complete len:387 (+),score=66.82 gnl/TRDRNA2_/TRDRNA2_41251_c0_seq1:58-1161(+)